MRCNLCTSFAMQGCYEGEVVAGPRPRLLRPVYTVTKVTTIQIKCSRDPQKVTSTLPLYTLKMPQGKALFFLLSLVNIFMHKNHFKRCISTFMV